MGTTVSIQEGPRQSARSGISWTPPAAATDVLEIRGALNKYVRILKITLSGVATAATAASVSIIRRSTANTGGTATTADKVNDEAKNSTSPSASVLAYTANPTTGTAVGTLGAARLQLSTASTVGANFTVFDFTTAGSQPPTLWLDTDALVVNLGGATIAGIGLSATIEWSEDNY